MVVRLARKHAVAFGRRMSPLGRLSEERCSNDWKNGMCVPMLARDELIFKNGPKCFTRFWIMEMSAKGTRRDCYGY